MVRKNKDFEEANWELVIFLIFHSSKKTAVESIMKIVVSCNLILDCWLDKWFEDVGLGLLEIVMAVLHHFRFNYDLQRCL